MSHFAQVRARGLGWTGEAVLDTYAGAYSWEIGQREKIESKGPVDLKAWTMDQIRAEENHAYASVWAQREDLGTGGKDVVGMGDLNLIVFALRLLCLGGKIVAADAIDGGILRMVVTEDQRVVLVDGVVDARINIPETIGGWVRADVGDVVSGPVRSGLSPPWRALRVTAGCEA